LSITLFLRHGEIWVRTFCYGRIRPVVARWHQEWNFFRPGEMSPSNFFATAGFAAWLQNGDNRGNSFAIFRHGEILKRSLVAMAGFSPRLRIGRQQWKTSMIGFRKYLKKVPKWDQSPVLKILDNDLMVGKLKELNPRELRPVFSEFRTRYDYQI
jgi:hypothetical protein